LRIGFQNVSETIYIIFENLPIETQNLFKYHVLNTKTLVMDLPQTNATNSRDLLNYQTQTDVYGMSTTLRMWNDEIVLQKFMIVEINRLEMDYAFEIMRMRRQPIYA
jgi:hypothetical protein